MIWKWIALMSLITGLINMYNIGIINENIEGAWYKMQEVVKEIRELKRKMKSHVGDGGETLHVDDQR